MPSAFLGGHPFYTFTHQPTSNENRTEPFRRQASVHCKRNLSEEALTQKTNRPLWRPTPATLKRNRPLELMHTKPTTPLVCQLPPLTKEIAQKMHMQSEMDEPLNTKFPPLTNELAQKKHIYKEKGLNFVSPVLKSCDTRGIRTPNLLGRNQRHYPVVLRYQTLVLF